MLLCSFVDVSFSFPDVVCNTTRTFDLVDHIGFAENWNFVFGGSEISDLSSFRENFDVDFFGRI